MSAFVTILAALHLAVPVQCYTDGGAYRAEMKRIGVDPQAVAFYDPGSQPQFARIALSPSECRNVLAPNIEGADTLAHELAHHWQWVNGFGFDELEAVRIARWARPGLLVRLEQVLHRKRKSVPSIVTLEVKP